MWPSRIAISMILLTVLSACTQPDKHPQTGNATFYVIDPGGEATLVPVEKTATWKIPSAVSLTFTACVKDRTTNSDLRRQDFAVDKVETGQRIMDVESLSNGCVKWTEELPFNYLAARSTYVKLYRDIVGMGVYPGKVRVAFGVNPWAVGNGSRDSGDAVVAFEDENDHPIPEDKLVEGDQVVKALTGELFGQSELSVRDVSIKTVREGNGKTGYYINSVITANPYVKVLNADNQEEYIKINGAQFDVLAHLVANNVGEFGLKEQKVLLTAHRDERSAIGVVENGTLLADVKAYSKPGAPSGTLELALMLKPRGLRDPKLSNLAFTGIYLLDDISGVAGNSGGNLIERCRTGKCDVEKYLSEAAHYQDLLDNRKELEGDLYLFQNLNLRFVQVTAGETATERTVLYAASTCVTDRWNMNRMPFASFKIEYVDEAGQATGDVIDEDGVVDADESGCLRWVDKIHHKYYEPEHFFTKRVRISRGETSRELVFFINPWDDKFVFGFDEREFGKIGSQELVSQAKKIQSRFYIADYGYHTVRFKYDIDPFMQLEVKKTVLMEIQPRVLRYSGIINARKMTESLRDGIYLMKVAIQKNYLDPADPYRAIPNKPDGAHVDLTSQIRLPAKEFISTKTALVRVTDGMIIQPIELSMHDLRLMRIRSNFLIQFETVDERKIQNENVFRTIFAQDLERLRVARKGKLKALSERSEKVKDDEKLEVWRQYRSEVEERRTQLETVFKDFNEQFDMGNTSVLDTRSYLSDEDEKLINDAVRLNDFTTAKLPGSMEMDLNQFVQSNSGLKSRTFVGPVIFLSNAYKDSVRATDNLDEACRRTRKTLQDPTVDPTDVHDDKGFMKEADVSELFRDLTLAPERENVFYTSSEYFGSLSHLCDANVDQMIAKEKVNKASYNDLMKVLSSSYNFAYTYGLNYINLRDVPLTKYNENCGKANIADCIVPTQEMTISRAQAQAWAGEGRIDKLLSEQPGEEEQFTACNIIIEKVQARLEEKYPDHKDSVRTMQHPFAQWRRMRNRVLNECDMGNSVIVDRKLRVLDTGTDYVYLGGLQLNFNVGNSFSVGKSTSWSGSAGMEFTDIIGPLSGGGKPFVKPFSLKIGKSTSMSTSDGTSVSQSAYLVSQIAKFHLNILKYEKCTVYRLSRQAMKRIADYPTWTGRAGETALPSNEIMNYLSRGIFVCDGVEHTQPREVDEVYFYFTQHFTEGDMLDQADPYNQPWLLALRGIRDFAVFSDTINAQEEVSLINYVKGTFADDSRPLGWPLGKMVDTYGQITPTFPGFYTLLDSNEFLPPFPLEQRINGNKKDVDLNCEMSTPDECYRHQEEIKKTGYFH